MKPGSSWRILVQSDGGRRLEMSSEGAPGKGLVFDELVISPWFHLEQMSARSWWMAVYGERDGKVVSEVIRVRVDRKGVAHVTHETESCR